MRNKKSQEPQKSSEQEALERKVDLMMDSKPEKIGKTQLTPAGVGNVTAPELPSKAMNKATNVSEGDSKSKPLTSAVPTAPLVIDKLDDMTAEVEAEPAESEEPVTSSTDEASAKELQNKADIDNDSDLGSTNLEDRTIDEAVDDIAANESDTVLALQDAQSGRNTKSAVPKQSGFKKKLTKLFKNKWTWIVIVAITLLIFVLPQTRYTVLGLFIKKSVTVNVIDSKTASPVSNAKVTLAGITTKTDGNGKTKLSVPVGQSNLEISKQYYLSSTAKYFVGLKSSPTANVKLVATGRLVPIKVTNKITGKPLGGALIAVLGTTAKTDSKGQATIALPTKTSSEKAKLTANGYNLANVTVLVTDKAVAANSFTLTPTGQIYFLSNLSGTLDVVKSNLDGTSRKVVLAGTGREDKPNTSLLASRDWRYLVLKSRREGSLPALYLIDTNSDKVTQFDNSDSNFTLVGWYGHNFVYDLVKNNLQQWQTGHQALKGYDADHMQLNQLDQSLAEGDANKYAYQTLSNYYIVNGYVAYNTQWSGSSIDGSVYDLSGKNDTIRTVQPNGQSKKDNQTFPSGTIGTIQATLYEPQDIYYAIPNKNYTSTNYYTYENQSVKPASNVDQNSFNQGYPTYLLSPVGNQTFWTDLRDGKNTLFLGDANAKNSKQIATLSTYTPYGWYTDSYLLVSKNSSELYVMPAAELKAGQLPAKITDYYKPAQNFNGYGYGYGGL